VVTALNNPYIISIAPKILLSWSFPLKKGFEEKTLLKKRIPTTKKMREITKEK
jgi:hypothetical protein